MGCLPLEVPSRLLVGSGPFACWPVYSVMVRKADGGAGAEARIYLDCQFSDDSKVTEKRQSSERVMTNEIWE